MPSWSPSNGHIGRKSPHLLVALPQLLLLSMMLYVMGYPFSQFASAVLLRPSQPLAYSLAEGLEWKKETCDTVKMLFSNSQNTRGLSTLV